MSYDMAVWAGERPADDDAAGALFGELAERYLEDDEVPATPAITRFVAALVSRWGDLDDPANDPAAAPWAASGAGDASGPILVVNVRDDDRTAEVAASVAALAAEHGLVCYDLQQDRVRTS